jgi:hypothetical protein
MLVGGLLLVGVQLIYVRPHLSRELLVSQSALILKESFTFSHESAHLVPVDELSFHNEVNSRIKLSITAKKRIAKAMKNTAKASAVNDVLAKADPDLQPILRILHQGGYDLTNETEFNMETISKLPKWSTIVDTYGPPRVLGLETCEEYRQLVPFHSRNIGVAGTFNSGTNLLATMIDTNCRIEGGRYNRFFWQVPWGEWNFVH